MKKGKKIGLFVSVFFVALFFSFILASSMLTCINTFVELSSEIRFYCSVGIGAAISIVVSVITVRSTKRICETRFSFWLSKNYPKLLISYIFLILALRSIKSEPVWDTEAVLNILSVQWTIFGLSLTVFFVWNVIIVEFLKKRQPGVDDSADLLQKYKIIIEKKSYSQEVETTFFAVTILTVNLFLLLLSTSQIYIVAEPDTLFTQTILRCSFFFTTNSIACLFLDILKPLKKEKTELIKNNNVTKAEIDCAHAALWAQTIIEGIQKAVMTLDPEKYTEEEKKQILIAYLEAFREAVNDSKNSKPDTQQK